MNSEKIILDLCGGTGSWSKPYKDAGYDVRVITSPDYDIKVYVPPHAPEQVYGILAAPPCTMFSFARTNAKKPRNAQGGMELVQKCLNIIWRCQYKIKKDTQRYSPLKFWCLENPYYGMLSWFLGKPVHVFNPFDYGDAYQKKTSLWGCFNIPKKNPVELTDEMKELAKTNSYLHTLGKKDSSCKKYKSSDRRAMTPQGFAKAFYEANK